MKPENLVFIKTFNTYEDAETHWGKLKFKEEYGIGVAHADKGNDLHFIIPLPAINLITNFDERKEVK